MWKSAAIPASIKQRFANAIYNAEIGTVLTDPMGVVIEKVSYSAVRINGDRAEIEDYLRTLPDDEAEKGSN